MQKDKYWWFVKVRDTSETIALLKTTHDAYASAVLVILFCDNILSNCIVRKSFTYIVVQSVIGNYQKLPTQLMVLAKVTIIE